MRATRRWSQHEDDTLRLLAAQGVKYWTIGERLGRTRGSIKARAAHLGIAWQQPTPTRVRKDNIGKCNPKRMLDMTEMVGDDFGHRLEQNRIGCERFAQAMRRAGYTEGVATRPGTDRPRPMHAAAPVVIRSPAGDM